MSFLAPQKQSFFKLMPDSDIAFNARASSLFRQAAEALKNSQDSVHSRRLLDVGIIGFLLLVTLAVNWRLVQDGITGLGDVRWHLTWLQHFSYQISEGIGYPRWLAGTNFGYGSPTFVFYPPFVYYLGTGLRALGFTFEQTVNLLFAGSVFLSGVSFYSYGRFRWGQIPGLSGALAYMLSPGLLGVVHGGGLAPAYSFVWLPLLLLLSEKSIPSSNLSNGLSDDVSAGPSNSLSDKRYRGALALVWGLVALTHLPSLLIYAIAWIPYTLYLLRKQPWPIKIQLWFSALIGWGLAAFFLIPAILEQRYINIDYMLASQEGFKAAMMNVTETLRLGAGSSLKEIFRQPIVQQWIACIVFALIAFVGYARQPKAQIRAGIVLAVAIGIAFLITDWSWPLWKIAPVVKKIEYSSRINRLLYLAQASLCAMAVQALLTPQWALRSRSKRFAQLAMAMMVCAILFNNFKAHHLEVRKFPGLYSSGNGVMLNRDWIETIVHDPFSDRLIDVPEYRPRLTTSESQVFIKEIQTGQGLPEVTATVSGSLPTPQPNQPKFEVAQGEATVDVLEWKSDRRRLNVTATTDTLLRLRIYSYPAWKMTINGDEYSTQTAYDGRIQLEVAPGKYEIILNYVMTPAFLLGISASVLSTIAFVGIYCYKPRTLN